MPIRTYDKTTSFGILQCVRTYPLLWNSRTNKRALNRIPISTLDLDIFCQLVFNFCILRSTGNVEPIRNFFELTRMENIENNHSPLFAFSGALLFPSFLAAHGKQKGMSEWCDQWDTTSGVRPVVSNQLKGNIPEFIVKSPKTMYRFLNLFHLHLVTGKIGLSIKRSETKKSAHDQMVNLISTCIPEKQKSEKLDFFSNSILLDVDEVLCGDSGPTSRCFPESNRCAWPGYGGEKGTEVYETFEPGDNKSLNKCDNVTHNDGTYKTKLMNESDVENDWSFIGGVNNVPKLIVDSVVGCKGIHTAGTEILWCIRNKLDKIQLLCLGLEKLEMTDGTCVVVVIFNGREIDINDAEHIFCKVYLWSDRARGNRSMNVPKPYLPQCWPTVRTDTVSNDSLYNIMVGITKAFKILVDNKNLGELYPPFSFMGADDL